jgi:hypothetical protein
VAPGAGTNPETTRDFARAQQAKMAAALPDRNGDHGCNVVRQFERRRLDVSTVESTRG